VDPADESGVRGYLRLSVSVLGPGDSITVRDASSVTAAEALGNPTDADKGHAAAGAGGAAAAAGAAANAAAATAVGNALSAGSALRTLFRGRKGAVELQAVKADGELADAEGPSLAGDLVLMPPALIRRTRWLQVDCYSAVGLPAMDQELLGGRLQMAGIDAFLEVRFAGSPPARTQWVTRIGTGNLTVDWHRQLWIPFQHPTFANRIEVAVWDHDRLKANDRVGEY
jgi:hypothetical protein